MKYPEIKLAQQIIQLCKSYQLSHVVISPGSRNAPLTMGFYEDPFFNCYSIVDERSAAFFGLGIAQQLKFPVILVCTSGSALLNYYPAISEAFYSDIPLVIISADRPAHKIDIGDGQTIRQANVFSNHIAYSANLSGSRERVSEDEKLLNSALTRCFELNAPVHINAPFEEPLYGMIEGSLPAVGNRYIKENVIIFEDEALPSFIEDWNQYSKKLVLVGVQHPNEISEEIITLLANDPSVIVLTETTSNLHHEDFFPAIDQLIAPIEKDDTKIIDLKPEMLITFGGMIISKKIKAFLRKYTPQKHYHIDTKKAYNTYFCLSHHYKTSVNIFFGTVREQLVKLESQYKAYWKEVESHRKQQHSLYISKIAFSDFWVYSQLFAGIPSPAMLQLSNSSTVRYAQLFELNRSLQVFCNRGTSGIDGSTSTAIGAANASEMPSFLITGDLSFFYDSNALWNEYIPNNFKIVVINNGGGGIFRILPGPKTSHKFHRYFETRHDLNASDLCKMYGLKYISVKNKETFIQVLPDFFSYQEGPILLEVFTPTALNDQILLDYFKFIR
ncbi:2-succinyl-5-enolpyruvyl-6-hydroxy-3-cyclohexene-1-carboxylic-acid synthase [Flavobacteriaceae bacterium M23B6Z8]